MSDFAHNGRCLCGGVEFRIKEKVTFTVECHCIQCRKFTGKIK